MKIFGPSLLLLIMLGLGVFFGALIHEAVNWLIFNAYGISSTIHLGSITGNDCPWNCQQHNYTTFAWTQQNPAQYAELQTLYPKSFAQMNNLISINESDAVGYLQFGVAIGIFVLFFIKLEKRFA